MTLLTTVIARHGDVAIVDCGLKSLTNEFGAPRGKDLPVTIMRLSEEHAHLSVEGTTLATGDKVELVPSHNDTTINLHSEYYVVRNGEVVDVWPIEAARAFR